MSSFATNVLMALVLNGPPVVADDLGQHPSIEFYQLEQIGCGILQRQLWIDNALEVMHDHKIGGPLRALDDPHELHWPEDLIKRGERLFKDRLK